MSKYSAFGTQIAADFAGGTTYTTIAQVKNITPPSLTRNTIDVTTHDSPDWWMEFIKGLKDGGEVSFDIVYDPALGSHDAATGLLSDFADDDTIAAWKITFPDTGTTEWTFDAIISAFTPAAPTDNSLDASITLKVAGKPTLA